MAASAASILMAGGAAIGAAGTATAAAPAVHTHVTTDMCFDQDNGRCFDHGGFGFDHGGFRFHHRFDHGGFGFDHRFDHGGIVIIVLR